MAKKKKAEEEDLERLLEVPEDFEEEIHPEDTRDEDEIDEDNLQDEREELEGLFPQEE